MRAFPRALSRAGGRRAGTLALIAPRRRGITGGGPVLDSSLAAPTLALASGTTNSTYPPSVSITIPSYFTAQADKIHFEYATDEAFSSPVVQEFTVSDTEAAAGTKTIGLSAITSGIHYFRAWCILVASNTRSPTSNIQGHGSTAAPVWGTAATQSVLSGNVLSVALAVNETCAFSIVGGNDQTLFQIAGSTLQWFGNGTQTYGSGADSGADNVYNVTLRATDLFGNTADLSAAVTVQQVTQPSAFSFTDVSNAAQSTVYTSNTITIAGGTAGYNFPASVSAGQYSKNGGAFTAAGSFTMQNGDTLQLKQTSSSSYSTDTSITVMVGTTTDNWDVVTLADPAIWSPDNLWLASENGDWWDVNDRSTMFQDTGGTVPVTAVGQSVKYWRGKRGNIVLTDTVGLLLQNDGTHDYLYSTGSAGNQKLVSTTNPTVTGAGGVLSAGGAFMVSAVNASRVLVGCDNGATNRLIPLSTSSTGQVQTTHFNTSTNAQIDLGPVVTANARFTFRTKHTATTLETWMNNTSDGATAVTGTLNSGATPVKLFTGSGASPNEGRIYSPGFYIIGRATTTTEDSSIVSWLA